MTPQQEIEALILQVALGDRFAFRDLYRRMSANLFGVCLRVLDDRAKAEEALQELLPRAWDKAGMFQINGLSPMTWLIAITRDLSVGRRRARREPAGAVALVSVGLMQAVGLTQIPVPDARVPAMPPGTTVALSLEPLGGSLSGAPTVPILAAGLLTCHVVGARAKSDAFQGMITDDGGTHPVPTLGGCTLQARMTDGVITLSDERGRVAQVTIAELDQSSGVIHAIDHVLLPAM